MTQNTAFFYLYRDGDNYKVAGKAVFSGPCSLELRDRISRAAENGGEDDYGQFIPGQVGLPDLQNQFYKAEIQVIDAMLSAAEQTESPARLAISGEDVESWKALRKDMAETRPQWNPNRDHPFHEITEFSLTKDAPTDPRSIEEFAADMERTVWDPEYLPPFHAEMLANYEVETALAAGLDAPNAD